ncbi:hypothetical protein [Nocardia bovistercoris]|uniref:DUF5753 domain-containing protein n=1 Tax=Nocardia bovistercoris TaxID=2785916 RepID=A0A931IA55_9NOCA|nr:hypothetical protein [Nocardia bovistercoris]MBH0776685.1 hypothetical protein [Nocardia bovistercoris]
MQQLILYDNRMVLVEAITAELTITQPREIAQYGRVFESLSRQAVVGNASCCSSRQGNGRWQQQGWR